MNQVSSGNADNQIIDGNQIVDNLEKYELEQTIRILEGRLVAVNNSNENLRAELNESDHIVYDRGTIQGEIQNLRRLNTQQV